MDGEALDTIQHEEIIVRQSNVQRKYMAVCDFRYGKTMTQRGGIAIVNSGHNGKISKCQKVQCNNNAAIVIVFEIGNEHVRYSGAVTGNAMKLGQVCGKHFDEMLNELGRLTENVDVEMLNGIPYPENRCAVRINELKYHSKYKTHETCSGTAVMRRAEFQGRPAMAGYVCNVHWKCMQCGEIPGGGCRFKKYTEIGSEEAWGLLCTKCSETRTAIMAAVWVVESTLAALVGVLSCSCSKQPDDNRIEMNNTLLARKQSMLKKYSEYGEIGKKIKSEMSGQGGMHEHIRDYLIGKIDGEIMDQVETTRVKTIKT